MTRKETFVVCKSDGRVATHVQVGVVQGSFCTTVSRAGWFRHKLRSLQPRVFTVRPFAQHSGLPGPRAPQPCAGSTTPWLRGERL